jgi:hypothetical protein
MGLGGNKVLPVNGLGGTLAAALAAALALDARQLREGQRASRGRRVLGEGGSCRQFLGSASLLSLGSASLLFRRLASLPSEVPASRPTYTRAIQLRAALGLLPCSCSIVICAPTYHSTAEASVREYARPHSCLAVSKFVLMFVLMYLQRCCQLRARFLSTYYTRLKTPFVIRLLCKCTTPHQRRPDMYSQVSKSVRK